MSSVRVFRATEVTPSGLTVTTTITADEAEYGRDIRELGELAQMGTGNTVSLIERNRKSAADHLARF